MAIHYEGTKVINGVRTKVITAKDYETKDKPKQTKPKKVVQKEKDNAKDN